LDGTRSIFGGALGWALGWAFGGGDFTGAAALPLALAGRAFAAMGFFVLTDLEAALGFGLFFLVPLEGFSFFGIGSGGATYNVSPTRKSSHACFSP
jgi:hypothetical protein